MLAAGSDWSVSSLDPLPAIQVAITRRDPEAPAGPAWLADELVPFDTALQAYTNNGAYAAFQEALTGSIAVGKAADLIVLNRDLSNATPQDIHLTRVVSTFVDGREVYTAPR
jgi:predicted amidohydrolase YtcJ